METFVSDVRTISLEENPEVINVSPRVEFDRRGGYLVADFREVQLRRYSEQGRLLWTAGRKGEGPGEFYGPTQLVRLPSGELLASDWFQRFVVYSDAGTVARTIRVPFSVVQDLEMIDDTIILVSGRLRGTEAINRLHLWNLARDTILGSFFAPVSKAANSYAADLMSWVRMDRRGDMIAAVYPVVDSVFFFTTDGQPLSSLALPPSVFRAVPSETPDDVQNPVVEARWLSTFDILQEIHYLSNGDLLLQYFGYGPDDPTLSTVVWHWLVYRREANDFRHYGNASQILAVDTNSDSLVFVTPGSELRNQWSIAHVAP